MNDTDRRRIIWKNEGTEFFLSTQQAFKGWQAHVEPRTIPLALLGI